MNTYDGSNIKTTVAHAFLYIYVSIYDKFCKYQRDDNIHTYIHTWSFLLYVGPFGYVEMRLFFKNCILTRFYRSSLEEYIGRGSGRNYLKRKR